MSLNLNIMCKHRVPGISSTLVNKIRDLLLELSGIGQKDKVMKDDQVASLASAALEGALELFLPAPEAQVTFVRHLLRGGRKKLLTRVLKHLHDSTQCTFSLVRDVRVCRFRENVHFFFHVSVMSQSNHSKKQRSNVDLIVRKTQTHNRYLIPHQEMSALHLPSSQSS